MEISKWNWSAERRTAIGDVANQSLEYAAERLLESRKRVFDAEHKAQQLQAELDVLKAAHVWIKPADRLPADDGRVLALVVDVSGAELIEIVNFIACIPEWRFDYGNELIDDEIVVGWMQLPARAK